MSRHLFFVLRFFVCVGTPLNSKNYLDVSEIMNAVQTIKKYVKHDKLTTICIHSTVLPETCDFISKKTNFSVVHNPEFLSQETAIDDFIGAKRIVIGSDNEKSMKRILSSYKRFEKYYNVEIPIIAMNTKDA